MRATIGTGCAIAVAAAVLGGCGSSSSKALTHAQLVDRANAICRKANDKVANLHAPKTPSQLTSYVGAVTKIGGQMIASLQDLQPPAQDRKAFQRYVDDERQQLAQARKLRAAAAQRNAAKVKQALAGLSTTQNDSEARALGLDVCAQRVLPRS